MENADCAKARALARDVEQTIARLGALRRSLIEASIAWNAGAGLALIDSLASPARLDGAIRIALAGAGFTWARPVMLTPADIANAASPTKLIADAAKVAALRSAAPGDPPAAA